MSKEKKEFEMKLSHFIITIILLIIGILSWIYGPTIVKSVNEYDSDFGEVRHLLTRNDKKSFFDNTPNNKEQPIIEDFDKLPNRPVLIILYRQHCTMCEVATNSVKGYTEQLNEKYDTEVLGKNIVYVNLKSPLGEKLVEEYSIERASAMLLLKDDQDEHTLLYRGEKNDLGETAPASQNITQIFEELDSELSSLKKYDAYREQ